MRRLPPPIAEFLEQPRIAVAGVSRDANQPANAIFRRLRLAGHTVHAVNPAASTVEGVVSHADLRAIGSPVDGLVIAAPPDAAVGLVQQCAELGIGRVWFHRSFGQGSVSDAAVALCRARGITCIAGGCPLMYCEPVDWAHRCMRWLLRWPGSR
jgi:predicted CoA-binding protein